MHVECFESNNIWKLEQQINNFIDRHDLRQRKVRIKYQPISTGIPNETSDDWNVLYTAMILYSGAKVVEKE